MKYKINDIFYSIQGEGFNIGKPAIFIRFSGCNLNCPFCDTNWKDYKEYTEEELIVEVEEIIKNNNIEQPFIIFTGGEPTLQLKNPIFTQYYTAIESNGLNPIPNWINWKVISPKTYTTEHYEEADEIKMLLIKDNLDKIEEVYNKYKNKKIITIQALEIDNKFNYDEVINFVLKHTLARFTIQSHKIINVK